MLENLSASNACYEDNGSDSSIQQEILKWDMSSIAIELALAFIIHWHIFPAPEHMFFDCKAPESDSSTI